ncbi:DUF4373 domain-containing protein [Dyadobacter sp. CY323]|uniref:DUF4373 domain-containing protein n=1 Tax=Dyadobacter sp. CY323 TaxID=2907302 RepID=UPI001F45727A|nr:DUF4373 domain-containing protein [Dyadobacter sp. CY323]MCE6992081.1 DUF4373 domain-containing protein [Dyadobacter sp. CY323]
MANSKTGFSYYSTDTDRYSDIKIKRLKKEFSGNGMAVYDYLLCEIYRGKGCYMEFDSNVAFDVSECFYIEESVVKEIVSYCAEIGLFDKTLFEQKGILTSISIQSRFVDWSKKAKRSTPEIPKNLVILPEESPVIPEESTKLPETSGIIEQNSVSLPQRKKERKEGSKKKDLFDPMLVDLPFDKSPLFFEAWKSWVEHRKQGGSKLTKSAVEIQLNKLGTFSEVIAVRMLEKAIEHNWTGIFELKAWELDQLAEKQSTTAAPATDGTPPRRKYLNSPKPQPNPE